MPRLFVAASLLMAGCIHVMGSAGDHGWELATTDHFEVIAEAGHAAAAAARLEAVRRELARELPAAEGARLPVQVYIFTERAEVEAAAYSGSNGAARFTDSGLHLVLAADRFLDDEDVRHIMAHELSHYVSAYAVRHMPRWLTEGLAGYYETILIGENGNVAVGRVPDWMLAYLRRQLLQTSWGEENRGRTLEWLWGWSTLSFPATEATDRTIGYRLSAVWLHLLFTRHPAELQAFFAALNRAEPPREAFARAFSGIPIERLERELVHHVVGEPEARYRKAVSRERPATSVRPLTPAEVHLHRAKLLVVDGRADPRELERALALDPKLLEARWLTLEGLASPAQRLSAGRALAEAENTDESWARFAALLLGVRSVDDGLLAVTAEHAARVTTDPRAQELVARARAAGKDWASAREHVERAIALAPWRPSARFAAAGIYAATGDCAGVDEQKAELLQWWLEYARATQVAEVRKALDAIVCTGAESKPLDLKGAFNPLLAP